MPRAVLRQKCGQCCKVISAARLHALHCRELLGCKEFPFCRRIKQNLDQNWKCDRCDKECQDRDTLATHITDKHKHVEKEDEEKYLLKSNLNKMKDMKTECNLEDLCHDPCDLPGLDCIKKELKTEIKTEPIDQHEYFESLMEVKKESFFSDNCCLVKVSHPWEQVFKEETIGQVKGNLDVAGNKTKQEKSNAASENSKENVELADLKLESQDCLYYKSKVVLCDKTKAVARVEAVKKWMKKMKAERLSNTALKKERGAERRRKAKLVKLSANLPKNRCLDDVPKQSEGTALFYRRGSRKVFFRSFIRK